MHPGRLSASLTQDAKYVGAGLWQGQIEKVHDRLPYRCSDHHDDRLLALELVSSVRKKAARFIASAAMRFT